MKPKEKSPQILTNRIDSLLTGLEPRIGQIILATEPDTIITAVSWIKRELQLHYKSTSLSEYKNILLVDKGADLSILSLIFSKDSLWMWHKVSLTRKSVLTNLHLFTSVISTSKSMTCLVSIVSKTINVLKISTRSN